MSDLIVHDVLDLTPSVASGSVVVGQHSAWLPELGVKVPFQWGGRLQKYEKPGEASYPLEHLGEDVALSRWLAERRMGPGIGGWHYFKTVISHHPGARWADPLGAYGYEMGRVYEGLAVPPGPPGEFSVERLRAAGVVEGSEGAWNDLNKPGNVVNGYLVDVRRSGWDRLRWLGTAEPVPRYVEDPWRLADDLRRDGQFPFRERELPYQECHIGGVWFPGERDVRRRAALLGFAPQPGETVLDVGCQLGGFLAHARLSAGGDAWFFPGREDLKARQLVSTLAGVDAEAAYVDLARRLARSNGWNVCFLRMDAARDAGALVRWVDALWGRAPDHLLLLSMAKHFPGGEADLWGLVDLLGARATYLESNAAKPPPELRVTDRLGEIERDPDASMRGAPEPDPAAFPLWRGVGARGGEYLGDSTDRNTRRLYRVPRAMGTTLEGGASR